MNGEKSDNKVVINKNIFWKRIKRLYEAWESGENGLSDVDAIYCVIGSDEDASNYCKSQYFQVWLYGMDMPDTLMVLTKKGVWVLASNKKADFFNPVAADSSHDPVPEVTPIHRNKSDKDKENFEKLVGYIKDAGNRVGCFIKDKYKNDFCADWSKAVQGFEMVDVSNSFSRLFSVKDEEEVEYCKEASLASCNVWNQMRRKYVDYIDGDRKISHKKASDEVETLTTNRQVQGVLAKRSIEQSYTPIVQSGGQYSFKWSAESTPKNMHFGVIMTTFGCRLESYCSNLSRTMLVDPSKELEGVYENVLLIQTAVIEALKPGRKLSEVYQIGIDACKKQDASLVDKLFSKEFGFSTGVEFRESRYTISPKCDEKVREGMVFIVQISVGDLKNSGVKDEQAKKVAISIGDTILVSPTGPVNLTEKARSKLKSMVIRIKEEDEEADEPIMPENLGRGKRSVVLTEHTRNKQTNEDRRKERQKELSEILNKNAQERLAQESGQSEIKKAKKSNVSYKNYEKFPQDEEIDTLMIHVDRRHDSVILPLFGVPVPFHISMIKNCSTSIESDTMYLRINFAHPGGNVGKENVQFPHPLATYIKELSFRATTLKDHGQTSAPSNNLTNAFRLIKEMQKKFRTEEAEEREKEGAVKQDKLIIQANKVNPKLKDLYVRPNIFAKRISGSLEAHTNGFRYTSLRGDKIDVLYNNIRHAFFQPCDNEMIILLHFHLKNPVLWGKKKYADIQFYTEVGEITTDLGKYHHMQDRDDVASEQMEREMRRKLNQTFQAFCDKVLKPTSSCLVHLTEPPVFVVTLDDVELVHFERVSFQLKNFDLVFIFKDYRRKTQMIQQIPMTSLDSVKEWLNSCDLKYTEGIQSLNWPKIMKTIVDDPVEFFQSGGWSFLDPNSDEEGENMEDESGESDAYTISEEESESGSDEDEDESEGEMTEDEGSDSDASLDSDESEGKDWSDLEEEARKADKRKDFEEIQEGGRVGGGQSSSRHKENHGRDRDRDRDRDRHRRDNRGSPKKRHGGKDHRSAPPFKKRK
ncbi:unnamed protein product, partial [Mesorhabditis belari]|uniref:FACT complex subunit n=1 Tax=Mesorhabditis belari TaxID=2138241 RepID=A0AAF3F285_9BILA